jgi:diketogulonate reductase-like aldo/keto reductase
MNVKPDPSNANPANPSRREVLRLGAGLAAGLALPQGAAAAPRLERPIPGTGETLPAIGLGTWQSFDVAGNAAGTADAREVLRLFVADGGRVVDSSPMYGSAESVVGELAAGLGLSGRLFLATKVWTRGREAGIAQMEESLRRMRAARLDLIQVHNLVDAETHLKTLREWQDLGRVRYLGITHYHRGAHAEMERLMRAEKLAFVQVNYSLAEPEAGERLLPLAAERGIAVIVNRPFAEGALFDRVRGRALPAWAAEFGAATWAQFFLKWILGRPEVTVAIPATRNPKHLADNLAAGSGPLPNAATRKRMLDLLRDF